MSVDLKPNFFQLPNWEYVFCESLSQSDFRICENFDLPHLELSLQSLAKLHSSYLLEENLKSFEEPNRCSAEEKLVEEGYKKMLEILVSNPISDDNGLSGEKSEKKLQVLVEEVRKSLKWQEGVLNVFCHGDLRATNILFRYKHDLPIECKFINWEFWKIVPPAYDVSTFLVNNTTEETRQHHLHQLLDHYYQSLTHELASSNFDIKTFLPRSEFDLTSRSFLRTSKLFNALTQKHFQIIEEFITNELLVTREDCYKVIGTFLGSSQYCLRTYKEERFSEKCGFLGDHKMLTLEIKRNEKTDKLTFFVKGMPLEPSQRNFVETVGLCRKETSFFNELIRKVQETGVDLLDRVVPKCYLALKNELLIFEDLSTKGFDKLYMRESYDFDTVSMILKKIAAFHASFLILEERLSTSEKKYRIIDHFKEELSEPFYNDTLISVKGNLASQRGSKANVDVFFTNQEGFKDFVVSSISKQPEQVKSSSKYRNTVCHGDLWTNNILVKLDQQNKPVDCLLVDLQTLRYNPPAHDVMTFLYLTTNRCFRTRFMSQCLKIYYQELSLLLNHHQVDVATIVSWQDFLASCQEAKEFAVSQSLTHFQNIMMTSEQVKALFADLEFGERHMFEDRTEYIVKLCQDDGEYKDKLGEAVSDLMEVYQEQLVKKM